MKPDFSGWATKNGLVCTDGLTIMQDAFKHNDQMKVPLVWQHQHESATNILGHVNLENRKEGVYAYGFFNETPDGLHAKEMVRHEDVDSMSIFANKLKKRDKAVMHGDIKEVSLVLSGANPGARIENVYIQHGDDLNVIEGEAVITTGLTLEHSESEQEEEPPVADEKVEDKSEKTVADIIGELSPEQRGAVDFVVAEAVKTATTPEPKNDDELAQGEELDGDAILQHIDNKIQEGFTNMHNLFEGDGKGDELKHGLSATDTAAIFSELKRSNSAKDVFESLAHAGTYGINDIDILFPDAKTVASQPELLARRVEWVDKVLGGVKRQPFSKIKSIVADLTAPEARAKGYIKGNEKVDEVIALMKRTTGATTIYKKQKLDRDDIIDITDFDVIAWLKWEIRYMLDEEIARAILIGDGRSASSDDKIKDPAGSNDGNGIRSIFKDHELYSHKVVLPANVSAADTIDEVTKSRRFYRGTGTPVLFTTDAAITDMLLLKDKMGRRLYETEAALASVLRVKEIVPVEVMEEEPTVLGIIVNLVDYTVGTNKGGEVNYFDQFDIDFNQQKYLMETRASGGLTKPKSAIVILRQQGTAATPGNPSFDGATNTITVPNTTGIQYVLDGVNVSAGAKVITEDAFLEAEPKDGYYIPFGSTTAWSYNYVG